MNKVERLCIECLEVELKEDQNFICKKCNYKLEREELKEAAQIIRNYIEDTGGTFSVRVQQNNTIWVRGAYTSGVHYSEREEATKTFLKKMEEIEYMFHLKGKLFIMA